MSIHTSPCIARTSFPVVRYVMKTSLTVQSVKPKAIWKSPAVLLEHSVQLLSSLLHQEKHLSIAAPTVVGARYIANRFSLKLPGPVDEKQPCVPAVVRDAASSCCSALRLRQQMTPGISKDILDRDKELRQKQEQYLQRLTSLDGKFREAQLESRLLKTSPHCLHVFPYLYSREWTPAEGGQGDLVFTDGRGLFAVVEIKNINNAISKTMQKRKLNFVKTQAQKYGLAFKREHPDAAVVIAGIYTEQQDTVHWIQLDHQKINRVRMLVQVAAMVKAKPDTRQSNKKMSSSPKQ